MEVKQLALVLADISGYTRFVTNRDTSLFHAEQVITELVEAVIASAEYPLTLNKLEGDAVFMYASGDDAAAVAKDVTRQVTALMEAFKARQSEMICENICTCDACMNIARLRLKAILHYGDEVAVKQIRQFEELAGEDVILIHRLLKNSLRSNQYILMSQRFYELSGGVPSLQPETRSESAEGFGKIAVVVFYPPDQSPVSRPASWSDRLKGWLRGMRWSLRGRRKEGPEFVHSAEW